MRFFWILLVTFLMSAFTGKPEGIKPVQNFDADRYLGKWYEVARLEHSFEKGLSEVTAEYTLRDDGGVKVINRGYSEESKKWSEAEGKAYFVEDAKTGYLKVSFFGPFYGSYIIFNLDDDYQYAFISGPDHDYLWLLSRSPTVSNDIKQQFIDQAETAGFDTSKLIFVKQTKH